MLRLSKLADYGIVILHCLSSDPQQFLSAKEIAQRVHLGVPTVSKLLKILSESGLVVSTRGSVGGYRLAKPSELMSVAEVIEAIEGRPMLTECAQGKETCAYNRVCAVNHNWGMINQFILDTLGKITLADMGKPLPLSHLQEHVLPPWGVLANA